MKYHEWFGFATICALAMLFALFAASLSFSAEGDLVLRAPRGGDYIVISLATCQSAYVNSRTRPDRRGATRNASYHYTDGRVVAGCWAEHGDHPGLVFLLFEDGDQVEFRKDAFKPFIAPGGV